MLSLATAILTAFSLRQALLDRAASRARGINGPVAMWANAAIWAEVLRIGQSFLLLLIGLVLLTLPSFDDNLASAWLWEAVEMLLAGASGLLLLASIHGAEARRLLREYLEPPSWDGVERRQRQLPSSADPH
jgi:hypothetical protein